MIKEKIFGMLIGITILITIIPTIQGASIPMPPPYVHRGDLVFADEMPKKPAINGWDHVALYNGSGYIIEADPHMEKWKPWERRLYPLNAASLHRKSYSGNENYGRVEVDDMTEIFNSNAVAYKRVKGASDYLKGKAADFAVDKATRKWTVGGQPNKPRPFDYKSFWIYHTKQVDSTNPNSLGFGYYCSELVWAAWKHAMGIDLDPNGNEVWPSDIYNSPYLEPCR